MSTPGRSDDVLPAPAVTDGSDGSDGSPAVASPGRVFEPLERRFLLGLFLAFTTVFLLTTGGHTYSIDEELMFQGTRSLVNLDSSVAKDFPNDELYRLRDDGSYVTVYGIGQSIVAVPFYVVGRSVASLADGTGDDFTLRTATFMTNAVLTAAITVAIAVLSRLLGASFRGSVLLAMAYGLGTFAFAHAKTFGSEPGATLLTLLACIGVIAEARRHAPRTLVAAGLFAGLAPLFRVSSLAFVPVIGLYVLWVHRTERIAGMVRAGARYSAGVFAGLAVLGGFNWWRYGSPIDIGYGEVGSATSYPPLKGLLNLYFSTGKGFFLFAPVCAVIVVGVVVGIVAHRRRPDAAAVLLIALIATNSLIIARLTVWSGDLTWGPRYLHLTLPLFVGLGASLVDLPRWRRSMRWATVVGFLGPAMLGSLLYFNVFFIQANDELGAAPVASEEGQPAFLIAVRHDLAWQQMLGNLELLPAAVRDTLGDRRLDDPVRYTYINDPTFHYGYFGAAPRVDYWWLWVEPTNTSKLTYLYFVPIALVGAAAARTLVRSREAVVGAAARSGTTAA